MSSWPSSFNQPAAVALLHWLDVNAQWSKFTVHDANWPNLDISSSLPLHIVKVCAVAIHRDELTWTGEEVTRRDYCYKKPGFEFSGYVVSTSPHSPMRPGTEV